MSADMQRSREDSVSHTPGPWHVGKMNHYGRIEIWSEGWNVAHAASGVPAGQIEANARLIASAPELLAALKELLASQLTTMPPFEAGNDAQNAWADQRAKARNDAAVVIAKAEGT